MNQEQYEAEKATTMKNLKLLLEGWEKLPFQPRMCKMGHLQRREKESLQINEVNDCGSDCCLLGACPMIQGLEIQDADFDINGKFCYIKYSYRVFPILDDRTDKSVAQWEFLFGSGWKDDKDDAFKRIQHFIKMDGDIFEPGRVEVAYMVDYQ